MKLHLPKQLFTALLAAITLAAPAAWGALSVEGADYGTTSTSISSETTIAPSADTAYQFTTNGKKLIGTASDSVYNIKLDGPATGNETHLDTIYAETLLLNTGRYYVNNLSDIANAGDIYVNAQLQFEATGSSSNNFILGSSSFESAATDGLGNVGLRIGYWNRSSGINKLTGTVSVVEDTRISFQSSNNGSSGLNLSGTLQGSGNIQLDRYNTTNSTLIISGDTSNFTGELDMDGDVTSTGSVTLALGTASVHLGGLTSNAAAAVKLYEGTTASELTLDVAGGKNLTYNGTIGSADSTGISIVKSGAGSQTLSGAVNLSNLTVNAGALTITDTITLSGTVTNNGALTITGTTTLSGTVTNNGTLTFGSNLTVAADTSLSLSGNIVFKDTIYHNGTNLDLTNATIKLDALQNYDVKTYGGSTYALYDSEGNMTTNDDGNGYTRIKSSEYWLVKGNSGIEGLDMEREFSHVDGETTYKLYEDTDGVYFSSGDYTVYDLFSITTGTLDVDAVVQAKASSYALRGGTMSITAGSINTSQIDYTSGTATLSSGSRLVIDSADETQTATHWLTNTTGEAGSVIEIAANANFGEVSGSPTPYVTAFEGKWVVTNGATLKLGGLDGGWSQDYSVDLQKLEALELDGGNLRYFGGSSTLSAVNVKQAGTLTVYEMYNDNKLLTIKDLNLTANLTLDTTWRSRLDIESLRGAGNLIINNSSKASSGGNGVVVNVNAADDFTGYLDINCGTHEKDAVNISTDANATVRILGDSNITISSLTLLEGAKLALDTKGTGSNNQAYSYNLKSVAVSDSATIETTQQHGGWQAEINIGSLTGSGSLSIESNAKTSQRSIINLEGGDFDGTLKVTGSSQDSNRKLALNVKDADALADAVVELHGNGSHVALAIGGDAGNSVTIKGIDDRRDANGTSIATGTMSIVSGSQSYGVADNFSSDGQVRTLVIDTDASDNAASVNSTTSAALGSYLNLQKKGVGSQTFNGNVGAFNGALDVQGGTLAFTGSGNMTATSVSVADGANLTLGGTVGLILAGGTAEAPATYSMGSLTSAGNTITVSEHAALSTLSNLSGTVTLAGSGLYELQDGAITMTSGVSLSGNWTGTVKMSNVAYDGSQANNNKMETMASTAGSGKLMLTNVNGWLGTGTMSKHLILENGTGGEAALYLSNGSSQNSTTKTATFSGGISGTGDIQFNWNKTGVSNCTLAHTISGDTASWSGKFISNESGSLDVQVDFTKGGEVFSSTVDGGGVENRTDNKLTVNVGSSDADTSFNGSIGKTSGAGAVELNVTHNNVTFNKAVNVDKLTVAQGASAQLGNTMTVDSVSFSAGESATAESPAKLTGKSTSALAQLAEDASFTIEDMTLTNTTITAATSTTQVKLHNVTASNVVLAKGKFSTNADMAMVGMGGSEGTLSFAGGLANESITINASAGASLTVDLGDLSCVEPMGPGKYDLSITLSGVGFDSYENLAAGSGIIFSADSWLGQLLTAQGATAYVSGAVETPASVSEGGTGGVSVSYSAATGDNVGTVITITGLNVPEPASATLGLAALMMLCSRRRRKA